MPLFLEKKFQNFNNELASKFHESIFKEDGGKLALSYLSQRNIDKDLIDKFKIGYCPEKIKITGKEFLSGSVIFPIISETGDVVAFSRRIPKERKDIPKDTPHWFHESYPKSYYFYGMNVSLPYIMKRDFVFVVEGQCDVIACYKHGFQNVVGTMGTALTKEHIIKLLRFTNNFVLMFDGDKAGIEATIKTKKLISELYSDLIKVKSIELIANGKPYDPDSFLSKFGAAPLKKHLLKIKEKENGQARTSDSNWAKA